MRVLDRHQEFLRRHDGNFCAVELMREIFRNGKKDAFLVGKLVEGFLASGLFGGGRSTCQDKAVTVTSSIAIVFQTLDSSSSNQYI